MADSENALHLQNHKSQITFFEWFAKQPPFWGANLSYRSARLVSIGYPVWEEMLLQHSFALIKNDSQRIILFLQALLLSQHNPELSFIKIRCDWDSTKWFFIPEKVIFYTWKGDFCFWENFLKTLKRWLVIWWFSFAVGVSEA